MMKPKLANGIRMLIDFIRRNPVTSFVLSFQILLVLCVALLLLGSKLLAQDLAVFAFVLLAIGVLLHGLLLLRHSKKAD